MWISPTYFHDRIKIRAADSQIYFTHCTEIGEYGKNDLLPAGILPMWPTYGSGVPLNRDAEERALLCAIDLAQRKFRTATSMEKRVARAAYRQALYAFSNYLNLRQGTLAQTTLQWSESRGVPEVTAPLAYLGRVYSVTAGGIVSCIDAKTGKLIFRGRVNAPGAYFASPVAADGKVFVASAEGILSVLANGDRLEVLANNDLGEPIYGTPAPVGSALYVRSSAHLWAFGTR